MGRSTIYEDCDDFFASEDGNHTAQRAKRGGLILRSPDGDEFILAEIDDFDREIELTKRNKELMKFLDERGKQTKTLKASEVREQLGVT